MVIQSISTPTRCSTSRTARETNSVAMLMNALQPARANTSTTSAILLGVSNRSRMNWSLARVWCEYPIIQLLPQIKRGSETPPTIVLGKPSISNSFLRQFRTDDSRFPPGGERPEN